MLILDVEDWQKYLRSLDATIESFEGNPMGSEIKEGFCSLCIRHKEMRHQVVLPLHDDEEIVEAREGLAEWYRLCVQLHGKRLKQTQEVLDDALNGLPFDIEVCDELGEEAQVVMDMNQQIGAWWYWGMIVSKITGTKSKTLIPLVDDVERQSELIAELVTQSGNSVFGEVLDSKMNTAMFEDGEEEFDESDFEIVEDEFSDIAQQIMDLGEGVEVVLKRRTTAYCDDPIGKIIMDTLDVDAPEEVMNILIEVHYRGDSFKCVFKSVCNKGEIPDDIQVRLAEDVLEQVADGLKGIDKKQDSE